MAHYKKARVVKTLFFLKDRDRISDREFRVGKRPYLSALAALGVLFGEPEMEKVVEGEFPEVFVPLLLAVSCLVGVGVCEPKPKIKSAQVRLVRLGKFRLG